jgi:hypothetical protein
LVVFLLVFVEKDPLITKGVDLDAAMHRLETLEYYMCKGLEPLRQTVPLPSAWVFAERYLSGAQQRPPLPSVGLSAKNTLGNDSFA